MPITTLAVQIRAFCASTSRAGGIAGVRLGLTAVGRSVEEVSEELGPGRVAQLVHGLGLDLADPLPGDPVQRADLIKAADPGDVAEFEQVRVVRHVANHHERRPASRPYSTPVMPPGK